MSTLILLYITLTKVAAIFIDADTRIKEVQIGNHEIKQKILPMIPPFFNLIENQYFKQSATLFRMNKENNFRPNFLQTLVYRSNMCYFKIYRKEH